MKDNDGVTITVDEFLYDFALGQLCTTDDIVTSTDSNGFMNTYTIELKANTTSGNDVDSNFVLYVGSIRYPHSDSFLAAVTETLAIRQLV